MACRLPNLFRHLYINGRSLSTSSYQTVNYARTTSTAIPSFLKLLDSPSPSNESNFIFSTRSVDFGFTIPPPQISRIRIIDAPVSINRHIEEPHQIIHNKEDKTPDKFIDLPTLVNIIEKQAVRMLIIRRHKMKVHKLKKLRKKLKYLNMKLKLRRRLKREKIFKKEIFAQIHAAEEFNSEEYVKDRLALLNKEFLPTRWRGEILPPAMIEQFLAERRKKQEAKRNRKRLTLD